MSVTVPTSLPIAVGTDGTVTTATNAQITNNSYGPVKVTSVTITAADDWSLTAFGDAEEIPTWAVDYCKAMYEAGYIQGDGYNLYPNDYLSEKKFIFCGPCSTADAAACPCGGKQGMQAHTIHAEILSMKVSSARMGNTSWKSSWKSL